MEVVCVSLPGYIIARQGLLDAEQQKFMANLNVMLFTPCLSMFTMILHIQLSFALLKNEKSLQNWHPNSRRINYSSLPLYL